MIKKQDECNSHDDYVRNLVTDLRARFRLRLERSNKPAADVTLGECLTPLNDQERAQLPRMRETI